MPVHPTVEVFLSWPEMYFAGTASVMRNLMNRREGTSHKWNGDGGAVFDWEYNGCLGEMATAKHFNLHWVPAGKDRKFDVGNKLQVRAIRKPDHRLTLHDDDHDDHPFVLAWVHLPVVSLMCWITARDGKLKKNWCDPTGQNRPAYFVPQEQCWPMSELLPELLA